MSMKIAVIGAGQAACSFAARYREHDKRSALVIIGEEPLPPYQRPPLSKKYITGEMNAGQLLLRPPDWYRDNDIQCVTGQQATAIDRAHRTVTLSGGGMVEWDRLVLATGAAPRSLPAAIGGALEGIYLLRNIADADQIRAELLKGRRVLVIGGGYIGLEASAIAAQSGLKVTLIEAADRILQRVACLETSDYFRKIHADNVVTIHENCRLDHFEETKGRVSAAILEDGTRIDTDFVLVGIGITPNTGLAKNAGLAVDGGIVVDAYCRTSSPEIFAAGDCTVFDFKGILTRLESVQNAIDQAECAADNMAGHTRAYLPVPWFWSDQYAVKLQIAGLNRGYDRIVIRAGERAGSLSHWYFAGSIFLAVDAINDPRAYMVGKKLLEAGRTITPEQAGDTSFALKALL